MRSLIVNKHRNSFTSLSNYSSLFKDIMSNYSSKLSANKGKGSIESNVKSFVMKRFLKVHDLLGDNPNDYSHKDNSSNFNSSSLNDILIAFNNKDNCRKDDNNNADVDKPLQSIKKPFKKLLPNINFSNSNIRNRITKSSLFNRANNNNLSQQSLKVNHSQIISNEKLLRVFHTLHDSNLNSNANANINQENSSIDLNSQIRTLIKESINKRAYKRRIIFDSLYYKRIPIILSQCSTKNAIDNINNQLYQNEIREKATEVNDKANIMRSISRKMLSQRNVERDILNMRICHLKNKQKLN